MEFAYKYQAINDFTIKALENNYLYFSKPSQLNDPFDCRFNIIYEGSEQDLDLWMEHMGVPHSSQLYLKKQFMENGNTLFPNNDIPSSFVDSRFNLLSLASEPDNLLMWSHYACDHTGICLKISTTYQGQTYGIKFKDTNFRNRICDSVRRGFLPLEEVKYSDAAPDPANLLTNSSDKDLFISMAPFLTTKSKKWEYEHEYRVFLTTDHSSKSGEEAQKIKYYPSSTIAGIIFGMRVTEEDQIKIVETAENHLYSGIKLEFPPKISNNIRVRNWYVSREGT
jgi:hypothetical protein